MPAVCRGLARRPCRQRGGTGGSGGCGRCDRLAVPANRRSTHELADPDDRSRPRHPAGGAVRAAVDGAGTDESAETSEPVWEVRAASLAEWQAAVSREDTIDGLARLYIDLLLETDPVSGMLFGIHGKSDDPAYYDDRLADPSGTGWANRKLGHAVMRDRLQRSTPPPCRPRIRSTSVSSSTRSRYGCCRCRSCRPTGIRSPTCPAAATRSRDSAPPSRGCCCGTTPPSSSACAASAGAARPRRSICSTRGWCWRTRSACSRPPCRSRCPSRGSRA